MANSQITGAEFTRHTELRAVVVKACTYCNAPGVYSADPAYKQTYPTIYVDRSSGLCGQPVGPYCPNCNRTRDSNSVQDLGVIWEKWVFPSLYNKIVHDFKKLLRRVKK
jgi:hypothetical protein